MKASVASALVAMAMSATVTMPASATAKGQSLQGAIQSAVSTGNVNVSVENGVATLFGWVDSKPERNAVKRVALSFDNVDSIIDLIDVSN